MTKISHTAYGMLHQKFLSDGYGENQHLNIRYKKKPTENNIAPIEATNVEKDCLHQKNLLKDNTKSLRRPENGRSLKRFLAFYWLRRDFEIRVTALVLKGQLEHKGIQTFPFLEYGVGIS